MFEFKNFIPGDKFDSEEFINNFSKVKHSLRTTDYRIYHNKYDERYEEIGLTHKSSGLDNYYVNAYVDYSPGATRFSFNLLVTDTTEKDPNSNVPGSVLLRDRYVFKTPKPIHSAVDALVLMSFFKKLTCIALNDIKLFQTGYVNISGPDGFSLIDKPGYPYSNKLYNIKKKYHNFNMETYYDKIINKLFNAIFSYDREQNPNNYFLSRSIFTNRLESKFPDVVPNVVNRDFSETGTVVYHMVDSIDFKDKDRAVSISGKDTECRYSIVSDEMAKKKHINNNRLMDLYIDLIMYYINNNFDVEKTLATYEYRRRPITIEENGRIPRNYESRLVKYVGCDKCIYEDDINNPKLEGYSYTISWLKRRSITLTVPHLKSILYGDYRNPIMTYTTPDKKVLDKNWLFSKNADSYFSIKKLSLYYRQLAKNEELAQCVNGQFFCPEQQVIITTYKKQVLYHYIELKKQYGDTKTREELFEMIDEILPQPLIRQHENNCR